MVKDTEPLPHPPAQKSPSLKLCPRGDWDAAWLAAVCAPLVTACLENTTNSRDESFAKRRMDWRLNPTQKHGRFSSVHLAALHFHMCVLERVTLNANTGLRISEWICTNLTKPACVTVKGLRRGWERSSHYYLMNDDVAVNYSAVHNT